MIKCEEVLRALYEYIDKELDEVSQAEIEEHLSLCNHCRRYHEFEVALKQLIHQSSFQEKAPEILKKRITEMLDEEDRE